LYCGIDVGLRRRLGAYAERSFSEVKLVFSAIENLWVVVALLAFIFSILKKVSVLSSLMYLIYYALMFWLGIVVVLLHLKEHALAPGMTVSMPSWFYILDGITGLIYLWTSIRLMKGLVGVKKDDSA
jgi:hypothetical protein